MKYYILVRYDEDWREQYHPTNLSIFKTREAACAKMALHNKFQCSSSLYKVEEVEFIDE